MVHGRVVRPPAMAPGSTASDEARVKACRDHRGVRMAAFSAWWRGARAGHRCAACADRVRQVVGRLRAPDPAKMYEQLMSLASEDKVIGEKDAPRAGRRQGCSRRRTIGPIRRMAAIAPSCAVAEFKDGKLRSGPTARASFRCVATVARALGLSRATSAASRRRPPAATVTTAPTTLPSTPPCWRAPSMGGRCGCNGMRDDEFNGSLTAPP